MNNKIVPKDIQERAYQRVEKFRNSLHSPQSYRVRQGQIWATHTIFELVTGTAIETNDPRLIVILAGEGPLSEAMEEVVAAPVSLATWMATDLDLLVPASASSLDFAFMIEVWNETPVLKGHLRRLVGNLSDEAIEALNALYESQLNQRYLPDKYMSWVGIPIMSHGDSRLTFQAEEVRASSYLAKAATAALGLEESEQEAKAAEPAPSRSSILFDWRITVEGALRRVTDVLNQTRYGRVGPSVAYAANAEEEPTLTFLYEGDEEQFLLELLNSRRSPYKVYLQVHMLSEGLKDRKCVVTLITKTGNLTSEPTVLKEGGTIVVGEDPYFERNGVENIEVLLEKQK